MINLQMLLICESFTNFYVKVIPFHHYYYYYYYYITFPIAIAFVIE